MSPRILFIAVMLFCFLSAGVNAIWFGLELRRFVTVTHAISSPLDIYRFKKVVAHQMYGALVQIVLLVTPPIVFFIGMRMEALVPADILWVIVPSAVIIVLALIFKSYGNLAKTIPAADSELEAQRDAIIKTWLRKPLPNW